ncbi:MAG TPA: cysteine--tRNA ligase [Acidiferrobacteraceae bacterium]|nr:cysteine--tRNA ligase [Acidiferrobacteraceae bacterium]
MTLRVYNSLTGTKEVLVPIDAQHVRMYVCGMTVYDYCHLGHARVMVVFDVVARHLRGRFPRLTYVRNITDIDDKIIARAAQAGVSVADLTARFIAAMHEDERALGVTPPDHEPRATAHMADILSMIRVLIEKGHAYAAGGDVYYRVRSFAAYGRLSGRDVDDLRVGARIAADERKDDPLDFVLWKAAKPGEPAWPSPWGEGRPGWHIECSAMSTHCLGPHFDIHGGGPDLKFPHHENEIAQSEAATGEPFANVWMHNGPVDIGREKMSKSAGNFLTIRAVLAQYPAEVVRLFLLSAHYRSPIDYSVEALEQARVAWTRLYAALDGVSPVPGTAGADLETAFWAAMDDDFNTPQALSVLFSCAHEIHRHGRQTAETAALVERMRRLGGVLGLLQQPAQAVLRGEHGDSAEIEALIAERAQARRARDWSESDRLRAELAKRGITLEDRPDGTTRWQRS